MMRTGFKILKKNVNHLFRPLFALAMSDQLSVLTVREGYKVTESRLNSKVVQNGGARGGKWFFTDFFFN